MWMERTVSIPLSITQPVYPRGVTTNLLHIDAIANKSHFSPSDIKEGVVMKIGDIVINPYVSEKSRNTINPMHKSMIIHIGKEYTTCLRYDGCTSKYFTSDVKKWEVIRNIDIRQLILGKDEL